MFGTVFLVVFCSYSVLLFLRELPTELDNPIVMESLRNFAENESEDTLNAFTSATQTCRQLDWRWLHLGGGPEAAGKVAQTAKHDRRKRSIGSRHERHWERRS